MITFLLQQSNKKSYQENNPEYNGKGLKRGNFWPRKLPLLSNEKIALILNVIFLFFSGSKMKARGKGFNKNYECYVILILGYYGATISRLNQSFPND